METQAQIKQTQTPNKPGVWRSIGGVITRPSATFARLAQEPVVLKPTLVLTALALLFTLPFYSKYLEYANVFAKKTMPLAQLRPGMDIAQIQTVAAVTGTVSIMLVKVLAIVVSPLVLAALLKLLNMVMGEEAKFNQLWSVAVFSAVPYLAGLLLSNLLLLTASGENLIRTLAFGTSLATLVPIDAVPAYLLTILTQVNVFGLWTMVLVTVGTAQVFRSKASKVGTVVFGLWLVYTLITAYFTQTSISQLIS